MSYCRWSSMDCQCDLYIYDDVEGGTTVHVAGRRRKLLKPLPPPIGAWWERGEEGYKQFEQREKLVDESFGDEWEPLPEKYAGKSFNFSTHEETAQFVEEAMAAGLKCPDDLPAVLRGEEDNK